VRAGDGWLHEIYYKGQRLLSFVNGDKVRLLTATGRDWTDRLPELADAIAAIPIKQAVIDGQLVAPLPNGASSQRDLDDALAGEDTGRLVYYAFDLVHLDGCSLRKVPLARRKEKLAEIIAA